MQPLAHSRQDVFFLLFRTGFYLVLPPVLLGLPADFFDHGRSVCPARWLSGHPCPGCGMTRALMHLVHLDLAAAAALNPLCFLVFPLLAGLWIKWLRQDALQLYRQVSGR